MNNRGFTLVELLATLVILGIVVGITLVTINGGFGNTKEKTEDVFVKTITDALDIYIDSDARNLTFNKTSAVCTLNKTHKTGVKVYKTSVTFLDVINSRFHPILRSDLVNPANKDSDNYQCFPEVSGVIDYGTLNIYVDEDYVYYYKIKKADFKCLNSTGYISNLPDECSD